MLQDLQDIVGVLIMLGLILLIRRILLPEKAAAQAIATDVVPRVVPRRNELHLVKVVSPPYLQSLLNPRSLLAAMQNDRFIVRWTVDEPMCQTFPGERLALKKARELFKKYGQDLEVAIHLNRVGPPPSLLYNSKRLRRWFQQNTTSP